MHIYVHTQLSLYMVGQKCSYKCRQGSVWCVSVCVGECKSKFIYIQIVCVRVRLCVYIPTCMCV